MGGVAPGGYSVRLLPRASALWATTGSVDIYRSGLGVDPVCEGVWEVGFCSPELIFLVLYNTIAFLTVLLACSTACHKLIKMFTRFRVKV